MDHTRAQLLLMLLASPGYRGEDAEPIQGTTRLQKLLFLLEREADVRASEGEDFQFTPWKFGPVSKELYDDLEKLENLGLLETDPVSASSPTELDEYGLSFNDLMGEEESQAREISEEKRYKLSKEGLRWVQRHIDAKKDKETIDSIRRIKAKYGALSLQDLLHYVYTKYPDMTSASEIKSRVLRR
jgi:uncharacterized protein YwgA